MGTNTRPLPETPKNDTARRAELCDTIATRPPNGTPSASSAAPCATAISPSRRNVTSGNGGAGWSGSSTRPTRSGYTETARSRWSRSVKGTFMIEIASTVRLLVAPSAHQRIFYGISSSHPRRRCPFADTNRGISGRWLIGSFACCHESSRSARTPLGARFPLCAAAGSHRLHGRFGLGRSNHPRRRFGQRGPSHLHTVTRRRSEERERDQSNDESGPRTSLARTRPQLPLGMGSRHEHTSRACAHHCRRAASATRWRSCRCSTTTTGQRSSADHDLVNSIIAVHADLQRCVQAVKGPRTIAYFSPEFGISETLPQYSGGLGILAGDHFKASSDLAVPLVGVGLFYREGLLPATRHRWPSTRVVSTTRRVDARAHRHAAYECPSSSAITLLGCACGAATSASTPLFMLDTDLPENSARDRAITDRLYSGDQEHRLRQELVLGVGGARALTALGIAPRCYHLNEGHAGLLILELLGGYLEQGLSFSHAHRGGPAAHAVHDTHAGARRHRSVPPRSLQSLRRRVVRS